MNVSFIVVVVSKVFNKIGSLFKADDSSTPDVFVSLNIVALTSPECAFLEQLPDGSVPLFFVRNN